MRKMLVRETALVLTAAVLAAGTLASCRTDVPDDDIPYSPYLRIEKRNGIYVGGEYKHGVYVAYGIYGDRIPEDGKIVIPDGVELDETWCEVYDESNKWLRTLEVSDVKSISIPAGTGSMTFPSITYLAGWPNSGEADIDIIYQGSLVDWCENGYLNYSLHRAKSIQVDGGQTDPRMLERITAEDIAGAKRIGGGAFSECEKLTSVEIPDSVTEIEGRAFAWCSNLKEIAIPDSVKEIGDSAFSGCSQLKEIAIPDSVTKIGDFAFISCTGLTSVTIGKGVTKIGVQMFEDCRSLTSVEIPGSVTEIKLWAFSGCESLESVTFAKTDGWYWVNSDGNKVSVDFSDPKNNASILKEEHPTNYARKTD